MAGPSSHLNHTRPFEDAVRHVLSTMARITPTIGQPSLRQRGQPNSHPCELLAMIGITGELVGTVAISMSIETARKLLARMLGSRCPDPSILTDEDLADGVGELVNLVAGSGKGVLAAELGVRLEITLPTLFRGKGIGFVPDRWPVSVLPFECIDGNFSVEIVLVSG